MGSGAEEDVPAAADMSEDATQTEADGTADTATEAASTAAAAAAAAAADAVDDDADESADSGDKDPAGQPEDAGDDDDNDDGEDDDDGDDADSDEGHDEEEDEEEEEEDEEEAGKDADGESAAAAAAADAGEDAAAAAKRREAQAAEQRARRELEEAAVVDIGNPAEILVPSASLDSDRYNFLSSSRRHDADTNWDELASLHQWSNLQTDLFRRTVKLLEECRLVRLAYRGTDALSGSNRESVLTCLHTSRATEKLRHLLAEVSWDPTITSWLNAAVLDTLDRDLLEEYIDILRHMRTKVPKLMETRGLLEGRGSRRLNGSSALRSAIAKNPDMVAGKTKDQWDFPAKPVVILAPGEHSWQSSYLQAWRDRFASLGKVMACPESASLARDVAGMTQALQRKIREARQKYEGRPVVLVGMSLGAKIAILSSFKEKVDVLICLSIQMPNFAASATDAVPTRDLFQVRTPILFAIGSQSRHCPVQIMEQVRVHMAARNKLVIVRDADHTLRIPLSKRMKVKLTQAMSDQLVLREMGTFVLDSLTKPPSTAATAKPSKEPAAAEAAADSKTAAATGDDADDDADDGAGDGAGDDANQTSKPAEAHKDAEDTVPDDTAAADDSKESRKRSASDDAEAPSKSTRLTPRSTSAAAAAES